MRITPISIVHNFIRRTSPAGLQEYFSNKHIPVNDVDWSQKPATVSNNIIQFLDCLPSDDLARLRVDAERISRMADELGQAALLSVLTDVVHFKQIPTALERSRWMYLHHNDLFRHAEDIRYSDHYRYGRDWNSYQLPANLPLHTDAESLRAFEAMLRDTLDLGGRIKVEHFIRFQVTEEGEEQQVIQVMVYQEDLPDTCLEFDDKDRLISRVRRPVAEHAIIYSAETGVAEVVAKRRGRRDMIAKAFAEVLLHQDLQAASVPLRRYNLNPLMEERPLTWDAEDGIETVKLVGLKVEDRFGVQSIHLKPKGDIPFYEYARSTLTQETVPGAGVSVPKQARISIVFHPENGRGRSRVLPVQISLPSGCNLRGRTERERLIGEKYLKRWGLLEEVAI